MSPTDFAGIQQALRLDVIAWHVGRLEATVAWLEANGYYKASEELGKALNAYKGV